MFLTSNLGFFKDESILTLIRDADAVATSQQLTPSQVPNQGTQHEKAIVN